MNDYNFFSEDQKKRRVFLNIHSPYFLGVMVLIICTLISTGLIIDNMLTENRIETLANQVNEIKKNPDYETAEKLQQTLDIMSKYDSSATSVLSDFNKLKLIDSDLITKILGCIPNNVTVVSFGIENQNLGMTCNAPDRKTAADLLYLLRDSGVFEDIQLNSVTSKDGINGVSVSINGTLKAVSK